jgi:hypothetical protein
MEPNSHQHKVNQLNIQGRHLALCLDYRWQSRLLHAMVKPWVMLFVETSGQVVDDSFSEYKSEFETVIWASHVWSSETIVQLILRLDGPTTSEVRWMLSQVADFQFGVKTLQSHSQFNGGEVDPASLKETTRRPPETILKQSKESVRKFVKDRKLELDIAMEGIARFDAS